MDKDLEKKGLGEAKATGEESYSADAVTPAGGMPKKRRADAFKTDETSKADKIEKTVKTPQGSNNAGLHEMIAAVFGDAELSEQFTEKTVTIFEAALHEKAEEIRAEISEEYEAVLAEQVAEAVEDLTEKVDSYLDYVVEKWMKTNEVALETGFKVQVAESILASVKAIVEEHNIDIDESDLDAITSMEVQVADANTRYNELFEEMVSVREQKEALEKNIALANLSEGLVATDAERLKVLAEGIAYSNVNEFTKKLETIKESYFTESVSRAEDPTEILEEEVEEEVKPVLDESVARYVASLNKYAKS